MIDFDTFKNRWEITAKLTMVTPLRIGGGQNAGAYSLSQSPVLLAYDAQTQTAEPYIPGSSLKGVLRSTVERIVRTINEKKSCIAVGKRDKVLCGDCVSCSIFGSQKKGASIRVQDAHLSTEIGSGGVLDERPHCATLYNKKGDEYVMRMRKQGWGGKSYEIPKTILRMEEVVAANTSFDLNINLDNADEHEVGLVLLALNEFNHKRSCLGGGTSRGNGFADMNHVRVTRKRVVPDEDLLFKVEAEQMDPYMFCDSARDYLRDMDNGQDVTRRDFDVYYRAYSSERLEGNLVIQYEVETLKDFKMPGVDETTVTNYGVPVIPGSTIKGFLRHSLIEAGKKADFIDGLFGSVKSQAQHRSRLLISDAFSEEGFSGHDMIPAGTILTMWAVFDNVDKDELGAINDVLTKSSCRITGKKTANTNKDGQSSHNTVIFSAKDLSKFEVSKYLNDQI